MEIPPRNVPKALGSISRPLKAQMAVRLGCATFLIAGVLSTTGPAWAQSTVAGPSPFVRSSASVGPTPTAWATGHQNLTNNGAFLPSQVPWLGSGPWWMDRFPYKLSSDTPIVDGVIYLTSGDVHSAAGSHQGTVWAIAANTGQILWQHQLPNEAFAEPVVQDHEVVVGVGNIQFRDLPGTHTLIRGTGVSGLWAFNATTGHPLWNDSTTGAAQPPPTMVGHTLYEVTGGRKLYVLNATTGQPLWTLALPSYVSRSSPRIVGHMLYVGGADPYTVMAVNLNTHKMAWIAPIPHAEEGVDDTTIAYAHGRLYTAAVTVPPGDSIANTVPDRQAGLYALNATNGQAIWSTVLTTGRIPFLKATGTPTVVNNTVYVGNALNGIVSAVNASTGHILWQYNAQAPVKKPPVVTPKRLYFINLHGTVYCLSHQGHLLGHVALLQASNVRGPVLVNHTLFAVANTASRGYLFALPTTQVVPSLPQ
ncbi:MAG: PQQ-binding-like beta-propeller repeat protein [Firmicutes bacterium]|nr:PQQ-binding-like beta-propeller repeat protein [Bacillota bacterium]MCL5064181.1 PQQ-binding-like beta-propeller repeat protein [Bacillota bacterium]